MPSLEEKENDEGDNNNVLEPRKLLDSDLVVTLADNENPSEVICQRQAITGVGNLKEVLSLRKVNLSFNPISSLKGIDQLKELRHLSAYCCRITNIDHLGSKRIESIMLQQNGLPAIPSVFLSFNKLKELRIDRNQITKLDNLSGCSSLRMLDVSYNKLTSLEGIAGLQSLSELRASHNQIVTLKHMRALPNLKEMNVSGNKLSNLIGLELLPSIEAVYAENNAITTMHIPQTYMSHLNKQLDKAGGGSNNKASSSKGNGKLNKGGVQDTSSTSAASSKRNKTAPRSSATSVPASSSDTSDTRCSPASAVVGLQYLSELYLCGNQIESLAGMEAYGTAIESIDFSDNNISDTQDFVMSTISCLGKLEDLKLSGNCIVDHDPALHLGSEAYFSDSSAMIPRNKSGPMAATRTVGAGSSVVTTGTTTSASAARLLRKNSTDGGGKAALDDNNSHSRRSSVKEKYSGMSLEKAVGLACPSLLTLDGKSVEKAMKGGSSQSEEGGEFHTWEDPSISVASESKPSEDESHLEEMDGDDIIGVEEEEEEEEGTHFNANNPKLVVETIVSREELLMHETVFRGLLQKTKDTITKAVKDNLPPEVGEEVTDLVLNVRPESKEERKVKPSDTTIGKKVRDMLEADSKQEQVSKQAEKSTFSATSAAASVPTTTIPATDLHKKPAQLSKNPSSLNHEMISQDGHVLEIDVTPPAAEDVILLATNRPNTPKTNAKIDRKIGSTKVSAVSTDIDKPPPAVTPFDLRLMRQTHTDIQSARRASDRDDGLHSSVDDRRRINSARMDSESRRAREGLGDGRGGVSMRTRVRTSSTSTVRVVNQSLSYTGSGADGAVVSDNGVGKGDGELRHSASSRCVDNESIHRLDMANMEPGLRRAGSAPLSTINSELDDDKSIQWNLMPPSEMPQHVIPPPTTIEDGNGSDGDGFACLLTEVDDNCAEKLADVARPLSSHGGVSLTKFRVPVHEEK